MQKRHKTNGKEESAMSAWGTGITQSDEYGEVYDRFMEEYDEGKPVQDIVNDILEEYLDQFEGTDGVLHDVYFALGKAEWMCGGISDKILQRITYIIENDLDIEFWRELEADEKDLKQRKKNLEKFLSGLKTPRGKTKKRKVSPEKYVPKAKPTPLPSVKSGDVLAYLHDGSYRIFALTERTRYLEHQAVYCYAWRKQFPVLPSFEQLLKEEFMPLGYLRGVDFPSMEKVTLIGNYSIINNLNMTFPHIINKNWRPAVHALAKEAHLMEEYPAELCMSLEKALEKIENLRKGIRE